MAQKKNFNIGGDPLPPVVDLDTRRDGNTALGSVTIRLPLPHGSIELHSFDKHVGQGYDTVLNIFVQSIRQMILSGRPEPYSVQSMIGSSLKHWFLFCHERAQALGAEITIADIDKNFLEEFTGWLRLRLRPDGERWSLNTGRTVYQKIKIVLDDLCKRQLIPAPDDLFPDNPFPSATALHNRRNYIRPMSDTERDSVISALVMETSQLFDGVHHPQSTVMTRIALCAFAMFLKTGLNATPLLELPRDPAQAFMDHPRSNRKILVTFKRRAYSEKLTPLVPAESRVVSLDVYRLFLKVREITEPFVAQCANPAIAERLWIFPDSEGNVRSISTADMSSVATRFSERNGLVRDDGTPMKITSQLFRNTRINRAWRATKGDLLATSRTAGNTPKVAESYLAVTPDMLEDHRLAGEVMITTLLDSPLAKTPIASCRDPIEGELAPKDGSPCMDFLSCFRCKSQVITGDDLHRLFSFYWALLNERDRIGAESWKKAFAHIIRVIDRDIVPRFTDQNMVEVQRARARAEPHPMWRSREALLALGSVL